jgi:hypothetical protein
MQSRSVACTSLTMKVSAGQSVGAGYRLPDISIPVFFSTALHPLPAWCHDSVLSGTRGTAHSGIALFDCTCRSQHGGHTYLLLELSVSKIGGPNSLQLGGRGATAGLAETAPANGVTVAKANVNATATDATLLSMSFFLLTDCLLFS